MPAMSNFIRQPRRYLRLWLLVAAATLAFVSVIEAGHAHGIFGDLEAGCALCQHNQVLDKPISSPQVLPVLLLVTVWAHLALEAAPLFRLTHHTPIRAPPQLLHPV
jgi:hypothetical protein